MLNESSSKPYYEQIKAYILYQINSGQLSPHDRVPSERSLSELFGVSRVTVSKALKELVLDGKLYTQVGKGTFVSEAPIHQMLEYLTSFSEEMEKRGQSPGSKVIEALRITATEDLAQRLDVPVGVPVIKLKRVRLTNGQPLALETAYLIAHVCEDILERFDFSKQSLYQVLQTHYNCYLTYADQELEARLATNEESQMLEVEPCSPILSMTRVTYGTHEQPIEYVESAYRGDRYKFRARLRHDQKRE